MLMYWTDANEEEPIMTPNKIMIVAGERFIALDLLKQMSQLAYDVVALADTGIEAIEKAKHTRPDLALMEFHLGGDIDAIATAKALWDLQHIPTIFLAPVADENTVNLARESRPYGYLANPVDLDELNATIQTALAHRQTQQQFAFDEERLRFAMDSAQLSLWEWNTATDRITTLGDFHAILDGAADADGVTLEGFLSHIHPSDRPALRDAMQSVRDHGGCLKGVFRVIAAGRPPKLLTLEGRPYDTDRIVGVIRQPTIRHAAHSRLIEAAAVFDTLAESVAILNLDGAVLSVNPAFVTTTGYSNEEIVNRPLDETLHIAYENERLDTRKCAESKSSWSGEVTCQRRNGETFTAWNNVAVACDKAGKPTHLVATITELFTSQRVREHWRDLAHHDALTGTANRLLLRDRLAQALTRATRNHHYCAVMFLDLDGFKSINDKLGHEIGDQLLQLTAQRANKALRASDTLARFGGDEFVIVANEFDSADAVAPLAEKLLKAVTQPAVLGNRNLTVTASMGIAVFPNDGNDAATLLKKADTAMYHAKHKGRNRFYFYTEQMSRHATDRAAMETALSNALERSELKLMFQPIINLESGEISGIEALLRWQHPTRGLLNPHEFIVAAEESGIMPNLGRWVLRAACLRASVLRSNGANCRLCVNVSPQQLIKDQFDETVKTILWETGFPGEFLELEVTESALQNIEQTRPILERLRALGVTIAVDDFGAGFSSLGALHTLPIDRLKLDRSFVNALRVTTSGSSIAAAVGQFARALHLPTTAMGIEQDVELNSIKEIGFTEGQGFLFSRPVEMPALIEQLRHRRTAPALSS